MNNQNESGIKNEKLRSEINDIKGEIKEQKKRNIKYNKGLKEIEKIRIIVNKDETVTMIEENSERIMHLTQLTQLNLTKMTVLTEVNFLDKDRFIRQKILLRMFDDKSCDKYFLDSKTMNKWIELIDQYGKENSIHN